MAINLLALEPHKVSRDLSGYITYIYGPPKSGKTTLGSQMPKPLLLAFERGYNAIGGEVFMFLIPFFVWVAPEIKKSIKEIKDELSR